jgi:NAD/NADP transhydrogenase alpha subunit
MSEKYLNEVERVLESIIPKSDVIICSLTIPGKDAPKFITKKMIKSMKKGSVLIDLSTELGGNCEMTL